MRPFFFGDPAKRLLGIHHPPAVRPSREIGVVLCYPMGWEYASAHRAYRVLAGRLAQAGFHVLRFDYYATGDSAGNSEEADWEQWIRDVHTAADELRSSHGVLRMALAGLRLGGTLAALVAAQRTDVEGLVLWRPVVDGGRYLEGLRGQHRAWLASELKLRPELAAFADHEELQGYPLPGPLAQPLERVDLHRLDTLPAREVLIISEEDEVAGHGLGDRLTALGAAVDHRSVAAWPMVFGESRQTLAHVPNQAVQAIVSWLSGVSV